MVGGGELVIAGGDAAPLLEDAERLLDGGLAFVDFLIKAHRPAASCALAFVGGDLVLRLDNGGLEPLLRNRARLVRDDYALSFVTAPGVGPGPVPILSVA